MHWSFTIRDAYGRRSVGNAYLQTIFGSAPGADDVEATRETFPGNLTRPYHSVNTDVGKRIRYL